MNLENFKVFLIEFGKCELGSYTSSTHPSIIVIATNYDEAANKALEIVKNNEKIIDSDGSLNKPTEEIRVKSVKIISETVIW